MHAVGQRIRALREAQGIGLDIMERRIQVVWPTASKSLLSRMERGKVGISDERLVMIAWALNVDPAELVRGLTPKDITHAAPE